MTSGRSASDSYLSMSLGGDLIIRGGYSIARGQCSTSTRHRQVAVVSVPDGRGEEVAAWFHCARLQYQEKRRPGQRSVSAYKVPQAHQFSEALPKGY